VLCGCVYFLVCVVRAPRMIAAVSWLFLRGWAALPCRQVAARGAVAASVAECGPWPDQAKPLAVCAVFWKSVGERGPGGGQLGRLVFSELCCRGLVGLHRIRFGVGFGRGWSLSRGLETVSGVRAGGR